MDKGYDFHEVREIVAAYGYTAQMHSRGEERKGKREIPAPRAWRWVVEGAHLWMNRSRRLLVRWDKRQENYVVTLHFACAWISFRASGVLG